MGGRYLLSLLNPPGQQTGGLGKCPWACICHINHLGRVRPTIHRAEDRGPLRGCARPFPLPPELLRRQEDAGLLWPDSGHEEPGRRPHTLTGRGASRRWA